MLSPDSQRVVFDCSETSYPTTNLCEVALDGTGFRTLLSTTDVPPGFQAGAHVHSGAYTTDGCLALEAQWGGGQQVWRRSTGATIPVLVSPSYTNDISPVTLPDGRIVSLWAGAPGANGSQHLKVMDRSGQNVAVLTLGFPALFTDIDEIGLGAGPF